MGMGGNGYTDGREREREREKQIVPPCPWYGKNELKCRPWNINTYIYIICIERNRLGPTYLPT